MDSVFRDYPRCVRRAHVVRPYKPAWSVEHALTETEWQCGHQFDPHLADLFLREHQRPQLHVVHKLLGLGRTKLLPDLHESEPSPI